MNLHLGAQPPEAQFIQCMSVSFGFWEARNRAEGLLQAGHWCPREHSGSSMDRGEDAHHIASGKSEVNLLGVSLWTEGDLALEKSKVSFRALIQVIISGQSGRVDRKTPNSLCKRIRAFDLETPKFSS